MIAEAKIARNGSVCIASDPGVRWWILGMQSHDLVPCSSNSRTFLKRNRTVGIPQFFTTHYGIVSDALAKVIAHSETRAFDQRGVYFGSARKRHYQ